MLKMTDKRETYGDSLPGSFQTLVFIMIEKWYVDGVKLPLFSSSPTANYKR